VNGVTAHLQAKVRQQKYRLTIHAEKEREEDQITRQELEEAVLSDQFQVIEDYPLDPRGPSCLLLGFTQASLPTSYGMWTSCGRRIRRDHYLSS
jgi:hypothetical protein